MVKPDKIIGKHIDQFTVESFIAEGAMGMVFKAYDSMLARIVALKLIPKTSKDATNEEALRREEAQKRFIHEAQTAGNLVHPNIVTIHSYGETDEFQYICMEYIKGKTLSQILKERGAIPVEEAIPILEQILLAVETAYKAGIVHRDIKPSNIMITEDNRVKVMDFGIAKLPSLSLTVTGMVLGTPFYMSPEQISGKKVDIRSDIFSLGAVFYELVTAEKPFEAENTATLVYKIVQIDPIPPNVVNVNIPQAVARVIFKALAKDPSQRYQKPAEMLKDMKALASASPTDSEAVIASQFSFDRTMLAGQPESAAPEIGHVSDPRGLSSGQQVYAAGPKGERAYHPGETGQDLREAKKTGPNIPAIVLLLLMVVCAGVATLWHFHRMQVLESKQAVPQQAVPQQAVPQQAVPQQAVPQQTGEVQQVQPPATMPANTQPEAGQPQVPQPGPGTKERPRSVEGLIIDAKRQFISNPQGAQNLLEEALAINPNSYDCLVTLARLLVFRKDPLAAIERYKQALSLNSTDAQAHYELGNVYMAQTEFDMAIESFKASIRLLPHNRDEVFANIGTCYMKKGDADKAKQFFKLSLEANPNNAAARSYMASVAATTTPSVSPGAGGKPSQSWQYLFDQQTAPQQPAPPDKTPPKSGSVKLEGHYTVEGINPDGTKYNGKAGIAQSEGKYSIRWKIADRTLTGTGTLSGTTLIINRKGPKADNEIVVYRMGPDGTLNGIWGSGKATETLKPVR
ncbi:MAG: protein kinase [Syntrophobacteraceae bacterium]|jgi:serine/threonine-protein kinase